MGKGKVERMVARRVTRRSVVVLRIVLLLLWGFERRGELWEF